MPRAKILDKIFAMSEGEIYDAYTDYSLNDNDRFENYIEWTVRESSNPGHELLSIIDNYEKMYGKKWCKGRLVPLLLAHMGDRIYDMCVDKAKGIDKDTSGDDCKEFILEIPEVLSEFLLMIMVSFLKFNGGKECQPMTRTGPSQKQKRRWKKK